MFFGLIKIAIMVIIWPGNKNSAALGALSYMAEKNNLGYSLFIFFCSLV